MSDGKTMELSDDSTKTQRVNVPEVKITYPVDEVIRCLPHEKTF